jgi:hypothetical protein
LAVEYNGAYALIKHHDLVKKLPAAGIMGPMASVKGVIHCGLGLTVVLFAILELL